MRLSGLVPLAALLTVTACSGPPEPAPAVTAMVYDPSAPSVCVIALDAAEELERLWLEYLAGRPDDLGLKAEDIDRVKLTYRKAAEQCRRAKEAR